MKPISVPMHWLVTAEYQLDREMIFYEDCPTHLKDIVLADVM
jgi:hypothetical protein